MSGKHQLPPSFPVFLCGQMHFTLRFLLTALVFFFSHREARASSCVLNPLDYTCSGAGPLPPKQDPWYTAPPDFELATPGTVLSVRYAPGNLACTLANTSAAYQILYRTTDSDYSPTWAVTTLLVPREPDLEIADGKTGVLLSYQVPYDSANLNESPSFTLYKSAPAGITFALGRGWYVAVPDYEGPFAAFTAGVMSGHATLDGLRAVGAAAPGLGLPRLERFTMWGYSGGGLATEWAAELQVQYAPEMKGLVGAALGGLTPNITNVMLAVDGSAVSVLIPQSLMGLSRQFPAVLKYIVSQLNPDGSFNRTGFLSVQTATVADAAVMFVGQNISQYFSNSISNILRAQVIQKAINSDGIMGYHGVPTIPLFAYHAIEDELSPVIDTDALVSRYCDVGANIFYQRNTVGDHAAEFINGDVRALEWLDDAFRRNHDETVECTIQNVTVANTPPSP